MASDYLWSQPFTWGDDNGRSCGGECEFRDFVGGEKRGCDGAVELGFHRGSDVIEDVAVLLAAGGGHREHQGKRI